MRSIRAARREKTLGQRGPVYHALMQRDRERQQLAQTPAGILTALIDSKAQILAAISGGPDDEAGAAMRGVGSLFDIAEELSRGRPVDRNRVEEQFAAVDSLLVTLMSGRALEAAPIAAIEQLQAVVNQLWETLP